MKQQLHQKRQILIGHLEEKITQLKKCRDQMTNKAVNPTESPNSHINIASYLSKNGVIQSNNISVKPSLTLKKQNYINSMPTKADVLRQQRQNKEKLIKLQELYHKKKQLQSIGIVENNPDKINGLFNNKDSKRKIDKMISESKKKSQMKQEKDRIIKEQLEKVQKFLKQSKPANKCHKDIPEQHFSKLFGDNQQKINQYSSLLTKNNLSLVQKDRILHETFQILRQNSNLIQKEDLKIFLLSNIQFCKAFYITKNQIMRDLQVYQTKQKDIISYQQFYEFIKSIQITNLALKPNLKYKNKEQQQVIKQKQIITKEEIQMKKGKEMEGYLKKLYLYLDNKNEKVLQRIRFSLALKKCLLYDDKKLKYISKEDIINFGQKIEKSKQQLQKLDYYKSLDVKYIGYNQIMNLYKSLKIQIEKFDVTSQIQSNSNQNLDFQLEKQQLQQQITFAKQQFKEQLQEKDFEQYGWSKNDKDVQSFKNLKQIDSYYKQITNKYGNEMHWNNLDHYQQDFNKFNQCIKQMNIQQINTSLKKRNSKQK